MHLLPPECEAHNVLRLYCRSFEKCMRVARQDVHDFDDELLPKEGILKAVRAPALLMCLCPTGWSGLKLWCHSLQGVFKYLPGEQQRKIVMTEDTISLGITGVEVKSALRVFA
jgi:hypothetical protein